MTGPALCLATVTLLGVSDERIRADHPPFPAAYDGPAPTTIRYERNGRPEPPTMGTHLRSALVGRWESEDYTLTIDQDAIQANRNPKKPFQWDALHILDATDNMIVFELGGDRFIALLIEDSMTLTQAGMPGYRLLVRKR